MYLHICLTQKIQYANLLHLKTILLQYFSNNLIEFPPDLKHYHDLIFCVVRYFCQYNSFVPVTLLVIANYLKNKTGILKISWLQKRNKGLKTENVSTEIFFMMWSQHFPKVNDFILTKWNKTMIMYIWFDILNNFENLTFFIICNMYSACAVHQILSRIRIVGKYTWFILSMLCYDIC